MSDEKLIADLMRDEGRVGRQTPKGFIHVAYPDPLSPLGKWLAAKRGRKLNSPDRPNLSGAPWTIGYGNTGRLIHEGLEWADAEARAELAKDVEEFNALLARVLPWIAGLDPVRRRVLQNMHYNMGWDNPRTPVLEGLAGFRNTLAAVQRGDYAAAANGMASSLWARQTGDRAERLIAEMRTGVAS